MNSTKSTKDTVADGRKKAWIKPQIQRYSVKDVTQGGTNMGMDSAIMMTLS